MNTPGELLATYRGYTLYEDAEFGADAPPIIVTPNGRCIQSDFECADLDTFYKGVLEMNVGKMMWEIAIMIIIYIALSWLLEYDEEGES